MKEKQSAQEILDLYKQWTEGAEVELNVLSNPEEYPGWVPIFDTHKWMPDICEYRIKPKKKKKELPEDIQTRLDEWYKDMQSLAKRFSALESDIDVWKRNTSES